MNADVMSHASVADLMHTVKCILRSIIFEHNSDRFTGDFGAKYDTLLMQ